MIPREIGGQHILQALAHVDQHGEPRGRGSRHFLLRHEGNSYSPKYVVSLACKFATGRLLPSQEFSGGEETNGFLTRMGFEISARDDDGPAPIRQDTPPRPVERTRADASHNERCGECKVRIAELLRSLYGHVEKGKSFDIPAHPDALLAQRTLPELKAIHGVLASLRGHRDFVKADRLPPCDYYVPQPGFVVEFDESQHFTAPRAAALASYPASVPLGFAKDKWIEFCKQISERDNDPPYRDEQRAWYDTLRDFLPLLIDGMLPTVRARAGETRWCDLEPNEAEDRAHFRDWLGLPSEFEVATRPGAGRRPFWARLIIKGPWYAGVTQARRLLEATCDKWPDGTKARVLVTCGGFVSFEWPKEITRDEVGDNRHPRAEALDALFRKADEAVASLLTEDLRDRLRRCADAITLGVDSFKDRISIASESIRELHAELVCLVDLRNGRKHWTGKSYPTSKQEAGLARVDDLASHFVDFEGEPMVLLGCHDLNVFSPRGNANVRREWRRGVIRSFRDLVRQRLPKIVIHHPHTTDSRMTWRLAWGELLRSAGSIGRYAGAGRYHNWGGKPRDPLDAVLGSTVQGETLDLVVTVGPT